MWLAFESGTSISQAHGFDDILLVLGSECPTCTYPQVDAGPTYSLPCDGGTVELAGTAGGCPGTLGVSWTASGGGNIVSGAGTLTPVVDAAGTYTLQAACDGECEVTDNTVVIERTGGDADGDGDVDLDDFAIWDGYVAGPGATPAAGYECSDLDDDADVDLDDFGMFQEAFGSAAVVEGACCNSVGTCVIATQAACEAGGGAYHGDGDVCEAVVCQTAVYSNEIDPVTGYFNPGANVAMADDLTLDDVPARELVYYNLAVYGGEGGVFDVTASLYTACPGEGGSLIAGSTVSWYSVPDDGYVYVLDADLSSAPIVIPNTVWMVVSFSTPDAGWVVAGEAETGATVDVFGQDDSGWGCSYYFDGGPYAGFWAKLECTD